LPKTTANALAAGEPCFHIWRESGCLRGGALEVLGRLDEDFLNQVKEKGKYSPKEFLKMPHVKSVAAWA
jgi:hypothetical protein